MRWRSCVGLLGRQRLLARLGLQAELLGQLAELLRGLGLLVAQLLGADLGAGDGLVALAQLLLDLGLGGGARAQLGGDALALGAVGGQLGLHLAHPLHDRLVDDGQDVGDAAGGRAELAVALELGLQVGDPPRALLARLGGPLGDAPLGGQLALELRAAHRGLALLGRLAALLDQPRGLALGLLGLRVARARPSRRARSASSREASAAATAAVAASTPCRPRARPGRACSASAISASRRLRSPARAPPRPRRPAAARASRRARRGPRR